MLQRFTDDAQRVILHAQEEALERSDSSVATEHVLLGLLRVPECAGTRLMSLLGVPPEQIREVTQQYLEQGGDWTSRDAPRAQRIIELAYQETRQFGNQTIDTQHLLLALIRERQGLAGRILAELGLELETVRAAVRNPPSEPLPAPTPLKASPEPLLAEGARRALAFAQEEASLSGKSEVTPEHLLLGLVREPDSVVVRLLATFGATPDQLHKALDIHGVGRQGEEPLPLALATQNVIERAGEEAQQLGSSTIDTQHLLLGLFLDKTRIAASVLTWLGLDYQSVLNAIRPPSTPPRTTKARQLIALGQQILRLAPELAQASPQAFRAALLGDDTKATTGV